MSNWKKLSKKLLVLLLASAIISGMMEHSWVTVMASSVEGEIEETDEGNTPETGESPEAKDSPEPEKNPEQTGCICTVPCKGADTDETDCPVCREDASKCSGKAVEADKKAEAPDQALDTEADKETKTPDQALDTEADKETGTPDQALDTEADKETETPDQALDQAAAAVEELIQALPSLEELKALDQEGQAKAYEQVQKAYEAYEGLTEEQKALLPGAEEQFTELLKYFTELITVAPTADVEGAKTALTNAMLNWEAKVDLSSFNLTVADMETISPDVAQDNPDLFYVLDLYYTYGTDNGIVRDCTFTYNPQYTQNSVAEYRAAIEKIFAEVINQNGTMTEEQKATALHDYLVQHMVYDQNANNNLGIEKRNAYEALVNGIGVCQGYTLAYAALLKRAGIEVDYCKSRSMNHIWNYVKLDGNWYHADLTYDDATAVSQMGATGYVTHTNFLLSDTAMRNTPFPHEWEPNGITCSDTKYDNSWNKTAPLRESAIYTVDGNSYYLKSETVVNNPNICRGASLIRRAADGAESTVGTYEIKTLGAADGWPMYNMCFSRLSCSKGVLYFNVGNSVYSYRPSTDTAPMEIYQYEDTDKRIVSGMLVTGDEATLELFNPRNAQAGVETVKVSLFTLNATETKLKVGYTTAPVLTANPLASGFAWFKQNPDGTWASVGTDSASYTVETGLPEGSYRYKVEAALGGKAVSAQIVITVTAQEEQKNFAFPASARAVTYGDPDFTLAAQGAATGSAVRYSSSDTSVASVDPATGAVKILGAGSAVITATASETEDYLEARSTYTLTVAPRALSWDVSALEARDRLDLIKNGAATLYGELKLAGILEKDGAAVTFACPADKLTGVYAAVAAGSQKVTLSWKNGQDIPVLQGSRSGNYTMPSALPQITGRISVVDTSLPSLPESTEGKDFKVQVESGISKVPDAFRNIEHLNTPGKIETQMKLKIKESSLKVPDTNIAVYDVELLININGSGWQKATVENFPRTGLTVTLPYPSGTGRDTHDFVVAHMFTADMNGFRAGDVEYPAVTKTENGIAFKVNGLSPVSVGWKDVENSGYNGGGSSGGPSSSADRVGAAATGDTSPVMLYVLLMAAAACGILIGFYVKRKRSR